MFLIAACDRQTGLQALFMPKIRVLKPFRAAFKACGCHLPPAALVQGPKRGIYLTRGFFTLKIIEIFNMKPEPGKAVYFITEPPW
jgi:hypothetical protein